MFYFVLFILEEVGLSKSTTKNQLPANQAKSIITYGEQAAGFHSAPANASQATNSLPAVGAYAIDMTLSPSSFWSHVKKSAPFVPCVCVVVVWCSAVQWVCACVLVRAFVRYGSGDNKNCALILQRNNKKKMFNFADTQLKTYLFFTSTGASAVAAINRSCII